MGLVVTAFTNGTPMNPATVIANCLAIRNWMNGGIVTADIINASVTSRMFRKMDHYGPPLDRSVGVTGSTLRSTVMSDVASRTYATADSHGGQWEEISTMGEHFYCPDAGTIEVVFEYWAWATQSDRGGPEELAQCDFRLSLDGAAIPATTRTLFDAGFDHDLVSDCGYFAYTARNFQALLQRPVAAGWHNLNLTVNMVVQAAGVDRDKQSLIVIGARNKHIEYWRR